jgi:hypothetical protein
MLSTQKDGYLDSTPNIPELRCGVCGVVKKQPGKNDDVIIDRDVNFAKGIWFCPNGHANKIKP